MARVTRVTSPLDHGQIRIRGAHWILPNLLFYVVLCLLLFWVPIVTRLRFPPVGDEAAYHLTNIYRFTDHFPSLSELQHTDLSMPLLFHGLMGLLSRLIGTDPASLRGVMIVIGVGALVAFGYLAHYLGAGGRRAAIGLVSFPYFGMTFFTVMTDFPAFLLFCLSIAAQMIYIRDGRAVWAWVAMIGAAAACLVRQNLVYLAPAFGLTALICDRFLRSRVAAAPRRFRPSPMVALLLPVGAVGLQVWLWRGFMPPKGIAQVNYVDTSPSNYLVSLISIAANVGYYLAPAVAIFLWTSRREERKRTWVYLLLGGAVCAGIALLIRGPGIVNTYGTFSHGLLFVRKHLGGVIPCFLMVVASLFSFGWVVRRSWRSLRCMPDPVFLLTLILLVTGMIAIGFGLLRIYERYTLPLVALALLLLARSTRDFPSSMVRYAWLALVAFGSLHGAVYAVSVYGVGR